MLLSPCFSNSCEVSQAVLTENSFESKNLYHHQIGKGVNNNQNDQEIQSHLRNKYAGLFSQAR